MKFLLLSIMSILSTAALISSTAQAGDIAFLPEQINQEISNLDSNEAKDFEDLVLPDGFESTEQLKSNIQLYKQIVEALTNNDIRSTEGRALTQAETNLLVKYFLQLKLDHATLTSEGFKARLSIANIEDKAQAIQILKNIATTRKEMDSYLDLGSVKCFFRNYKDPNAAFEEIKVSESFNRAPLTDILRKSDEATVVGKCRGCGLLSLHEFSMVEDQRLKYPACVNEN